MKIYTKIGDKGTTRLVDGSCVEKFNPRVEAYGCLDELNSQVGLALVHLQERLSQPGSWSELISQLQQIQSDLFTLGSLLATDKEEIFEKLSQIEDSDIEGLERWIDHWSEKLPALKNFILPGGSVISAQLHVCRTFCRRAERRSAEIYVKDQRYQNSLIYLNRLSDYFFVLARLVNHWQNITDPIWIARNKSTKNSGGS